MGLHVVSKFQQSAQRQIFAWFTKWSNVSGSHSSGQAGTLLTETRSPFESEPSTNRRANWRAPSPGILFATLLYFCFSIFYFFPSNPSDNFFDTKEPRLKILFFILKCRSYIFSFVINFILNIKENIFILRLYLICNSFEVCKISKVLLFQ